MSVSSPSNKTAFCTSPIYRLLCAAPIAGAELRVFACVFVLTGHVPAHDFRRAGGGDADRAPRRGLLLHGAHRQPRLRQPRAAVQAARRRRQSASQGEQGPPAWSQVPPATKGRGTYLAWSQGPPAWCQRARVTLGN
eukprot:209759-Prorocentrum_minimum.AAC.2